MTPTDAKPAWTSKTIWVNMIALLASLALAGGFDLGLDAATQTSLVGGIMAVVNVVLRLMTTTAIGGPS